MKGKGRAFALVLLFVPCLAAAQKRPSNSMHTRSAEIYLDRSKNAQEPERSELLEKALETLNQGVQADASNPKVWFMLGQVYVRLGRGIAADSAFDRAESIYPDYAKETEPERLALWIGQYNKGVSAVQAGNTDEAIASFEAANAVYQGRPDAQVTLGSLYAQKGDLARAEAAYRGALDIASGPEASKVTGADREQWMEQDATAATRLGSLLEQTGKADQAIAVYEAFARRQPGNATARANLAAALAKAGRADEAARIYDQLLTTGDLSDTDWFNAGVRLYTAEQYDLAMKAFRKSIEKNPYSRDAMYNLGQAIYAETSALETARKDGGAPSGVESRLATLYRELLDVGSRMREIDPNFRNAMMMIAQAERSLGDLAGENGAKEWQDKVVATLEQADELPFEVGGIEMRGGNGTTTISGHITNLKLPAGQSVALEFTLVGEGGRAVASQTVSVKTADANANTPFSFDARVDGPVLGWKYRVAS